MRKILPKILAFITGRERYLPRNIEWVKGNWTHNIFRAWEVVFWKSFGPNGRGDTLRREAASAYDAKTGKTYHAFYTMEAAIAHFEGEIRAALKGFRLPKIQVYVPVFQPAGMPFQMPVGMPTGYLFAIARDAHVDGHGGGSSLSSINWNHTCTGSNRILTVFAGTENSVNVSGMTYNSVSMTTCGVNSTEYSNTHRIFGYYLIAPATGTNSIVVTHASSCYSEGGISMSYTGAKQSGQPDAAIAISEQFGTSASTTLTTIADNCWIVACGRMDNGGTRALTGVLTALDISAGDTAQVYGDSNGALTPAGGKSVGLSSTVSDEPNGVFFSIAPLTSTTYNQSVTATIAVTGSMTKGLSKTIVATSAVSGKVLKQLTRSLVATTAVTGRMFKQMAKSLVATTAVSASMLATKVYLQALTATTAITASITKIPGKLLSASTAVSASIAKVSMLARTLTATTVVTGAITKGLSKTIAATTSVTASVAKTPNLVLRATTAVTASISNSLAKVLVATTQVSATLIAGRAVIMTATVTTTATVGKTVGKLLKVTTSITAKILAPFWRTKYPSHGDEDDYQIKYPHD